MNPFRRVNAYVKRNKPELVRAALHSIADDYRSWRATSGTIVCPACRHLLHYAVLEQRGEATGRCSRNGCLSVYGCLPTLPPLFADSDAGTSDA
jgi:hypothetical protein